MTGIKLEKRLPDQLPAVAAQRIGGAEMEYPTNEQVRIILEAEGYTPEQIDAALQITKQGLASISEALEAVRDAFVHWVDEIIPWMEDLLAQIGEINFTTPPKMAPRPPRYAGPKNKGNPYTQQPPRVARSCCRKMRR